MHILYRMNVRLCTPAPPFWACTPQALHCAAQTAALEELEGVPPIMPHIAQAEGKTRTVAEEQLFFLSFAQTWCGVERKQAEETQLFDAHAPRKWFAPAPACPFSVCIPAVAPACRCSLQRASGGLPAAQCVF